MCTNLYIHREQRHSVAKDCYRGGYYTEKSNTTTWRNRKRTETHWKGDPIAGRYAKRFRSSRSRCSRSTKGVPTATGKGLHNQGRGGMAPEQEKQAGRHHHNQSDTKPEQRRRDQGTNSSAAAVQATRIDGSGSMKGEDALLLIFKVGVVAVGFLLGLKLYVQLGGFE